MMPIGLPNKTLGKQAIRRKKHVPLEVDPLNPARRSVSSPSGVWGEASAEIEFGALYL